MSLYRAELARFFARRITRVMALILLILLAITGLVTGASTHHATAEERAQATQVAALNAEQLQAELDQCEQDVSSGDLLLPADATCNSVYPASTVEAADYMPHEWNFADDGGPAIVGFGSLLAMVAFVIGASFIGAEWSSAGMMNLLLWRPRRGAVLAAKLAALGTGVAAIGAAAIVAWLGFLTLIAKTRGHLSLPGHVVEQLAYGSVRALTLAAAAGVLAFALASIGRHTATALGVVVAYLLVWEIGFRALAGTALRMARPERWMMSSYVMAWLDRPQTYFVCRTDAAGVCRPYTWQITTGSAVVIIGATLLVALAVAAGSIYRRDVP